MLYLSRRHTLIAAAAFTALRSLDNASALAATPSCDDHPTTETDEGPYFKPKSPERASLIETGIAGAKLIVTGNVLSVGCKPLAGALLDFWQADGQGDYDNAGFHLRGHQHTDANGRFRLETVLPGIYTGRTRHIHVKAMAPGGGTITTQLFFPNERGNGRDRLFRPDLVMAMTDVGGQQTGEFDFVLKTN